MGRKTALLTLLAAATVALAAPASGRAMGSSSVAATQVALMSRGLYAQTIDGVYGPATARAIRRFQRAHRLVVDGVAGMQTRRALGRLGWWRLGTRLLRAGRVGYDVSQLQFLLAWHGFPSGPFDGGFGPRTQSAVIRFQRHARLVADGVVGPATVSALRRALPRSPLAMRRPIAAPVGDGFGPRGNRFHAGLDFPARYGARVRAARSGRVFFAGWDAGGFGNIVRISHGYGVSSWYAHLSRVAVRRGQWVRTGRVIGRVGATGDATGPHLHFQVMVRGAAVNPLTALR